jgi:predicted  nucleic acid-binding Zn-ribbon protein
MIEAAPARSAAELAARLREEAQQAQGELEEIDLLVSQARSEAARHESRRKAAADKLAAAA